MGRRRQKLDLWLDLRMLTVEMTYDDRQAQPWIFFGVNGDETAWVWLFRGDEDGFGLAFSWIFFGVNGGEKLASGWLFGGDKIRRPRSRRSSLAAMELRTAWVCYLGTPEL